MSSTEFHNSKFFQKSGTFSGMEKIAQKLGVEKIDDTMDLIPVSSLEEVAIHLKNDDESYTYQHFLVQLKSPIQNEAAQATETPEDESETSESLEAAAPTPPPFRHAEAPSEVTMNSGAGATSGKTEAEDVSFLAENAKLLFEVGETNLARNVYRAILKTGEASDVAYAGLARCADRDGMVDQAIQFAWDSVAFSPNQEGYQILAQLLVQQGRDREASQALSRALKSVRLTSEQESEYQKTIGNCMSRLGETAEAEAAFKRALELNPTSDEIQSNLGSLYLEQGQMAQAKRCYQDAIAANATNDKAWVGFGLCCVSEGDKEAAHEAFAKALDRNLRNSTAIFHLVKCAYEIKKYSTAEKILSSYVEVAPVSPSLLYSLAGLQFHVGKKTEATDTAKRILQIKVDHQGAKDLIRRIEIEA